MAKVVRIHTLGGPEVLQIEDADVGEPGPGEVRIRVEAVGLNRAEAMYRAGRYPVKPQLPSLIGYEGVGASCCRRRPGFPRPRRLRSGCST